MALEVGMKTRLAQRNGYRDRDWETRGWIVPNVDVLAYMSFPKQRWAKLHSTHPIERLNGEIKRRTEVVGIFPNFDAIVRWVDALLLEQNDEWAVQRSRYMTLETIATMSDDPLISLPAAS